MKRPALRPARGPDRPKAEWVQVPKRVLGWPQGHKLVDGRGRSLIELWWCDRDPSYGKTNHYRVHLPVLDLYFDCRSKTLNGALREAVRRCRRILWDERDSLQFVSSWLIDNPEAPK